MEEKRGYNRFSSSSPSFFFIQNISKHFFLVDSGQNWQTTGAEIIGSCQLWKKWGFLTKIMGYSPGLWKNSHFGDYIKLSFYCITSLVFHFENQQTFNISCRFCTKPNNEKKSNFLPKIMGSGTRRRTPKNVCVGVPSGLCALSQKTRVSPTLCKFYG